MTNFKTIFFTANIFGFIGLSGLTEGAFPLIFPFLTSGWYYKPTPAESVVLGLILVKVLALRLASATGILPIPYHLNDLFIRSIGKRSVGTMNFQFHNETDKFQNTTDMGISSKEFQTIERILLSLRRIDTNDCFIKVVCEINQDLLAGKVSSEDEQYIEVFRLRQKLNIRPSGKWTVWDSFENAIKSEVLNCSKKFHLCPLSKKDLEFEALLTGFF